MERIKTIIPPTKSSNISGRDLDSKKRVAAYCRVSTKHEEQATSIDNQIEEWTNRLKDNEEYEFVGIYSDYGISGTSLKHRDGFNNMIEDAKLGKIDLIFCKSISRFARNTVVTVQTVRELKALGVGVYFDNELFDTLGPESELVLCVLSATAQAESEHISRNVTWTLRKNMDEGLPMVNTTRFLGYDKSEDGKQLVINEDEAEIVRLIFNLYDSGEGCLRISKILQEKGYKTAAGSEVWYTSTILDILRNEKYIGELLLQKTYTVDCLTHTKKTNKGERQQYHFANAHEAIISKAQWDRVQARLATSKALSVGNNPDMSKYNNRYPLSGVLVCGNCGNTYKRRTFNSKTSKTIGYQCNTYIKKNEYEDECHNKPVSENLTHKACCDVINKLFISKSKALSKLTTLVKSTLSTDRISAEIKRKLAKKDKISEMIDEITRDKVYATNQETKDELDEKRNQLLQDYTDIQNEITALSNRKTVSVESSERMNKMLQLLSKDKITPELLTNEMITAFFSKIFVTGKNELVFVINTTKNLSSDEMIERRKWIINQEAIYENSITEPDPIKKATINFKVVLV